MKKRIVFAHRIRNKFCDDNWTKTIAFYLDGTGFAYKRSPLDQALCPSARVYLQFCIRFGQW